MKKICAVTSESVIVMGADYSTVTATIQHSHDLIRLDVVNAARRVREGFEATTPTPIFTLVDYATADGSNSYNTVIAVKEEIGDSPFTLISNDIRFSNKETLNKNVGRLKAHGIQTEQVEANFLNQVTHPHSVSLGYCMYALHLVSLTEDQKAKIPTHIYPQGDTIPVEVQDEFIQIAKQHFQTFLNCRHTELHSGGELILGALLKGTSKIFYETLKELIELHAKDALPTLCFPAVFLTNEELNDVLKSSPLHWEIISNREVITPCAFYTKYQTYDPTPAHLVDYANSITAYVFSWSEPIILSFMLKHYDIPTANLKMELIKGDYKQRVLKFPEIYSNPTTMGVFVLKKP